MSDQPLDQTTFVDSVELREDSNLPPSTKNSTHPPIEKVAPPPKPPKKPIPLPFLIGGVVLIFFVILLVAALLMPRSSSQNGQTDPQATQTPMIGEPLPQNVKKSIDELDASIKESDPQNNDLPFPPVNFQLHLVPPPLE